VRNRLGVCALWLGMAALVSLKAVFVSAPLEVSALAHRGNYSEGTDVYGIKWEKGMSELRILLSNHTDYDYDDVDISFTPNVPTRKVTQVSKILDMSLAVTEKAGGADAADIRMDAFDQNGKILDAGRPTELYASGQGFRMRCPKIPKGTTVELLVALVMPPMPSGREPKNGKVSIVNLFGDPSEFVGPKRLPTTVYFKGQYTVLKPRHQLFVGGGSGTGT
jgi:hypothetical protein